MKRHIAIILHIFILSIVAHAAEEYTIPKKHRVIQESSTQQVSAPVDTRLPNVTFTSLKEKTFHLNTLTKQGPVVFVFLSAECPVAQRYAMRLKRINSEFYKKQVSIVGVYSNENDSVDDVKAYITRAKFTFPIVKDTDGSLARHLGATMTPQAHLVDTSGVLRYRGPIDDNRYETRVKHNYLKDALVAVLNRKLVIVKETPAFGCTIHLPDLPIESKITYSEHIAPILQKHCQTCHLQDGIAPFTLVDYEDVKTHAAKIAEYTQTRYMPPWRPVEGYGDFKNERKLTDTEIEMIQQWVKTDTLQGLKTNDKTTTRSSETWTLGEPDSQTEVPIEFKELTEGKHATLNIVIKTDFEKNMYVRAIDFQSENKKTVRRIIANLGSKIKKHQIAMPDGKPINSNERTTPNYKIDARLGTWAPGFEPSVLSEGIGYLLPKGGQIILDVLYKGTDRKEQATLQVGLYFSKTSETAQVHEVSLNNYGDDNEQKNALSHQLKSDAYLFALHAPTYMDKQGLQAMTITPTDERIKLLWIKASHFEWLDEWLDIYHYREPIFLPAGSRLELDIDKNSEHQNSQELSNQKNKKTIDVSCHFYYVLASEYTPRKF